MLLKNQGKSLMTSNYVFENEEMIWFMLFYDIKLTHVYLPTDVKEIL